MKTPMWKFWTVIGALVLMIVSYIISESTKVSIGTANFFNVVAIVLLIGLVGGGIYWFATAKGNASKK